MSRIASHEPVKAAQLRNRFGRVIRRRRLIAQVGQEALADKAKIHRTHLSLIERGGRMPTLYVVHLLARALDTTNARSDAGCGDRGAADGRTTTAAKGTTAKEGKRINMFGRLRVSYYDKQMPMFTETLEEEPRTGDGGDPCP